MMKTDSYKNVKFRFSNETGVTICEMKYNNQDFTAMAVCAPEDEDMLNEKTGQEIAFNRACVKVLQYEKQRLKTENDGLKSFYYSIKHSKKFNPKSYEAKMLMHQINIREQDIAELKTEIKELKDYIKRYVDKKDEFYKDLRRIREKSALEQGQ